MSEPVYLNLDDISHYELQKELDFDLLFNNLFDFEIPKQDIIYEKKSYKDVMINLLEIISLLYDDYKSFKHEFIDDIQLLIYINDYFRNNELEEFFKKYIKKEKANLFQDSNEENIKFSIYQKVNENIDQIIQKIRIFPGYQYKKNKDNFDNFCAFMKKIEINHKKIKIFLQEPNNHNKELKSYLTHIENLDNLFFRNRE